MRKIVDVGDTTRKIEHGFVEKGLGAEEIELKREDVKMTSILECNLCGISKGLDEKKWKYADGDAYVTMRLCKRCLINFYEWMLWEMPVKLLSRRHSDMGMIFEEYAKAKDISFAEFQGCEQGVPMFKLRLADNTIKVKCEGMDGKVEEREFTTWATVDRGQNTASLEPCGEDRKIFDEMNKSGEK